MEYTVSNSLHFIGMKFHAYVCSQCILTYATVTDDFIHIRFSGMTKGVFIATSDFLDLIIFYPL